MSSIILAPSLVNQKKEAIISYCEKRASRISTIEAKKKKRGDTELNELNESYKRYTSHCCKKKEVSVYATANIQWSESILGLGRKFEGERLFYEEPMT